MTYLATFALQAPAAPQGGAASMLLMFLSPWCFLGALDSPPAEATEKTDGNA